MASKVARMPGNQSTDLLAEAMRKVAREEVQPVKEA